MKSRLFVGLVVVLIIVAAGSLFRSKTVKSPEAATQTPANASNAVTAAKDARPASAVPAAVPATSNAVEKPVPAGPPVIASSVMPGAPMVRGEVNIPRSTSAVASAKVPVRQVSQPEARADIQNVGLMFRDYRTRLGGNPVGSNREIMKSVMGGNSAQATLGPPPGQTLNDNGELVDRWGTPYFFHQLSKTHMEIRSAGPDQKLWTSDDVVGR